MSDETQDKKTQDSQESEQENTPTKTDTQEAQETIENQEEEGANDSNGVIEKEIAISPELLQLENERLRKTLEEKDKTLLEQERTLREYISSHRKATQEFEAVKERLKRDIDAQIARGRSKFLVSLLDVIDNLDRSLAAPEPEGTNGKALLQGVNMVRGQFMKKLEENGVKRLDTKDQRFDPELHEAVSTMPAGNPSQDGLIAQEFRAGYMLGDKLLRPAQVVVFKKPS